MLPPTGGPAAPTRLSTPRAARSAPPRSSFFLLFLLLLALLSPPRRPASSLLLLLQPRCGALHPPSSPLLPIPGARGDGGATALSLGWDPGRGNGWRCGTAGSSPKPAWAPTMASVSSRLRVFCPQAGGNWGSGAPGKGVGKEGGFSRWDRGANSTGVPAAPGRSPGGFPPRRKRRGGRARAGGRLDKRLARAALR